MKKEFVELFLTKANELGLLHKTKHITMLGRYDKDTDMFALCDNRITDNNILELEECDELIVEILDAISDNDLTVEFKLTYDNPVQKIFEHLVDDLSRIEGYLYSMDVPLEVTNREEFDKQEDVPELVEQILTDAMKASGDEVAIYLLKVVLRSGLDDYVLDNLDFRHMFGVAKNRKHTIALVDRMRTVVNEMKPEAQ